MTTSESTFTNVFLFVYPACRMHCLYCQEESTNAHIDVDPAAVKQIISKLGQSGTRRIWLTGGEAILSPHILEYIQEAKDSGMSPRFSTQDGRRLKELAPFMENISIQLSLNGIYEDHDEITQVANSFQDIQDALESIKDDNTIDITARIIIRPDMKHSCEQCLAWCRKHAIKNIFISNISPNGKGQEYTSKANSRYTRDEFQQLTQTMQENNQDLLIDTRYDDTSYGNIIGIYPTGDIYAMPTENGSSTKLGNMLEENISSIYERYKKEHPDYHKAYQRKTRRDGTLG